MDTSTVTKLMRASIKKDGGMAFEEICRLMEASIKKEYEWIRRLIANPVFDKKESYPGQHEEMKSNIMLAYRDLKDVQVRIGKVLQAAGDGISILDKQPSLSGNRSYK